MSFAKKSCNYSSLFAIPESELHDVLSLATASCTNGCCNTVHSRSQLTQGEPAVDSLDFSLLRKPNMPAWWQETQTTMNPYSRLCQAQESCNTDADQCRPGTGLLGFRSRSQRCAPSLGDEVPVLGEGRGCACGEAGGVLAAESSPEPCIGAWAENSAGGSVVRGG